MLHRLYTRYGESFVRKALAGLTLIIILGIYVVVREPETPTKTDTNKLPTVTLTAVRDFGNESSFSVVGTVRAISEAKLQAEAGGRITSVPVRLGDTVYAGAILGTIENSAESATLLQAQGAYDAAVASSRQSGSNLDEAKVGVRNTYRNAFSTADDVVRNLTDEFFSSPTTKQRGFRLGGTGQTATYNATRGDIETILINWSGHVTSNFDGQTEAEMLAQAESDITTISNFTAGLARIISDYDADLYFTDDILAAYETRLTVARASLDNTLASISASRNAYDQAVISASGDTTSQSSAHLKSALGTLRSAQANYEKTIVRTPISGTVNALYLKQGEYINNGAGAAIIANNGSLEITTAIGEKDLPYIKIGDFVRINETASGTVTKIAPAIDPTTGKSEVQISADDTLSLKNGSTVSVRFIQNTHVSDTATTLVVPLKAIKMLASGPITFGVVDTKLVSYPVVLGAIRGDSVEITSGLTPDSLIITDARGLKEGDSVTVTTY